MVEDQGVGSTEGGLVRGLTWREGQREMWEERAVTWCEKVHFGECFVLLIEPFYEV